MSDDVAARLARLESVIDDLRAEVDDLRSENVRLRRGDATAPAAEGAPAATSSMGRRRLLVGGATAGAAAVAGVVATGQPVAAANGSPMILGQSNDAAGETKLVYGGSGNNGFRVEGTSSLALIEGFQGGTGPGFKGANTAGGPGVQGVANTGIGVYGQASGANALGVRGDGDTGVYAKSTTFRAIHADSAGTYGITVAMTGTGTGINVAAQGGNGLQVESIGGNGVLVDAPRTQVRLKSRPTRPAPTGDVGFFHEEGDLVEDGDGNLWLCVFGGSNHRWRKLGGPATAGQLHVLPSPARVYDSRAGTLPTAVGPKTKFAANETRTFDLKVNGSGVPADATAALVTLLVVDASTTAGNMTIWANGVTKPLANTMVWGGTAGRFTATATTALDSQARVQVNASQPTNLVIDVVGFYR